MRSMSDIAILSAKRGEKIGSHVGFPSPSDADAWDKSYLDAATDIITLSIWCVGFERLDK